MKISVKLSCVLMLAVSSVYATNGDNLIATGAKSRGMGGVGIAKAFGAESGLANPALLSSVESMEVAGSLTFFSPDVSFQSNSVSEASGGSLPDPVYSNSESSSSVIPEASFAQRISDEIVYGVSVTGTALMGVDYSESNYANGSLNMKTQLQLLKIAIPFSYQMNSFSLGLAPIIQYGTLELSHIYDDSASGDPADLKLLDTGGGSDSALGFEIGMAYDFKEEGLEGLTLGLVYKSELAMNYTNTLSASIDKFDNGVGATGITSGDNLDQPEEYGVGASYVFGEHNLAFDYKNIAWGSSDGFKDFGWEDQDIYALGYAYTTEEYTIRVGYNYAKSPVKEQDGSTYAGAIKNSFNLAGFPGIVETHYTLGGSYIVNEEVSLDFAMVYASEVSESFDTSAVTAAFIVGAGGTPSGETSTADVKHSQFGLSFGASYRF